MIRNSSLVHCPKSELGEDKKLSQLKVSKNGEEDSGETNWHPL